MAEISKYYDFIWLMNLEGKEIEPPAECELIFSQGALTLWRIRHSTLSTRLSQS
jgi:hypothetical protein